MNVKALYCSRDSTGEACVPCPAGTFADKGEHYLENAVNALLWLQSIQIVQRVVSYSLKAIALQLMIVPHALRGNITTTLNSPNAFLVKPDTIISKCMY